MPATGATLPSDYFDGNPVQWWITSMPPYYCQNSGAPGMDFSTDSSWGGVSISATVATPTQFTTGVKYAPQFGGVNKGPRYVDNTGADQNCKSIDDPSTQWYQASAADGDWALQTSYEVSTARYDLPFGPYQLNLTTDSTPYPAADGDIIVITTGSTVIAGAINEGPAYSANDTRAFNLIFYSTGSANVNDLVTSIPENASPSTATLPNYNASTRESFVGNSGGLFAFVAIPNDANSSQVMWWPISYDGSAAFNAFRVISRNDS
ncbi:hypothetical protein [Winogradskyella sp.]|uniref:hypothetical protein n=1 Tax=Winogradskyella sp. TaxID=1883156 RepID=UPI003511C9D9